jgi:hypothetical protein
VKHRGIDFDVREKPPSWWHWKSYPKIEASPAVVGNMKFQTRAAAIAACIVEINSGFDRPVAARNRSNPRDWSMNPGRAGP